MLWLGIRPGPSVLFCARIMAPLAIPDAAVLLSAVSCGPCKGTNVEVPTYARTWAQCHNRALG